MTRTNKTAAAAPAPEPGSNPAAIAALTGEQLSQTLTRKQPPTPRASAVKVAMIDPAKLAAMTPAQLRDALKAATVVKTSSQRPARPRVTLTPDALAAFEQLGWSVPYADARYVVEPQHRQRFNNSKGAAAYTVAVAALQVGPITLTDLARLWIASGNPAKLPGQIAQQIANRAQRPVIQTADTLQLA